MRIQHEKPLLLIVAILVTSVVLDAKVSADELNVKTEPAFPKLEIYRPVVITHAGDGTNRLFVAQQDGVIHWLKNDQATSSTTIFMDIKSKVTYKDKENEEGLLGMAFHPKYKENGEFFVYYTTSSAPHTSVVSRFKTVDGKGDPDSEEELFRLKQPFWNHNGGTIEFGPDGQLYIALGDGGKANDPLGSGQNLGTWLGSILRIDVDTKDPGKNYGIPNDNPFVDRKGAKPEIWAYGVRNIWRLTFDRETGQCWAADVGQNLWEEINIIRRGGNYGWNVREASHPFGENGSKARPDLIDPVFEYHHSVGKSITGGYVYRGRKVPSLVGRYLYADYVTGKVWALKYDSKQRKVESNVEIPSKNLPIITFGEDEQGEVYFSTHLSGGRLYRFVESK